ncbi:hypothetical protein JIG36_27700 [Actinoplanes sp. LDG1-06]|uniref:Uncharacterized protein n=1 Tax=Paractinoplanes ovalisporus TaxID=2810368 RepID=A0ABS2AHP9_9ACTN|nr:hypothetical protein [Actinoplanes ovalisporus]MBM2619342.1 hypothetical protein [Actinoplanes ovalisporus]
MTPSTDDLRNAMNDLARTTDPLDPDSVLRSGKRRRSRRRATAAAGAAVALIAVTGGIFALRPGGDDSMVVGGGRAIQDLDNSLTGLDAGNYAFTRTGAYMRTDIVRAQIDVADGYLVEYSNKLSLMRAANVTYLKPSGGGTYSGPGILEQLKNAGLSDAEADRYAASIAQLDGTRWLRVDQQRLVKTAEVDEQSSLDYVAPAPTTRKPDITGADALIEAVTTAERKGDTVTGTLDATKVDDGLGLVIGEPESYYGPSATSMTYRATLDGQGRLASFTLNLPGTLASQAPDSEPEPPLIITITQYDGVEAPPAPPSAENITELTYDLLARDND